MASALSEKLDVCIWTKNSARLLPQTLRRLEEVVPSQVINNKIMVDDHSEDDTIAIGRSYGWSVYTNPGRGVASGANEALRHVVTNYFISVEHDVLLALNWWPRVFENLLHDERTAISQGARVSSNKTLYALYEDRIGLDDSLDNNIYRTDVIKRLGGFPSTCLVCTDVWLRKKVESAGYKWIIDPSVVSEHIRSGIMHHISHSAYLHRFCTCKRRRIPMGYLLRLTLTSPLSGLKMALRRNAPQAAVTYPYLRLRILQACLTSKKTEKGEQASERSSS